MNYNSFFDSININDIDLEVKSDNFSEVIINFKLLYSFEILNLDRDFENFINNINSDNIYYKNSCIKKWKYFYLYDNLFNFNSDEFLLKFDNDYIYNKTSEFMNNIITLFKSINIIIDDDIKNDILNILYIDNNLFYSKLEKIFKKYYKIKIKNYKKFIKNGYTDHKHLWTGLEKYNTHI